MRRNARFRSVRVRQAIGFVLHWLFRSRADWLRFVEPDDRPNHGAASGIGSTLVKPNPGNDKPMMAGAASGGRFIAENAPLNFLIRVAYSLKDFQIHGGPAWVASDRYDIAAKRRMQRRTPR